MLVLLSLTEYKDVSHTMLTLVFFFFILSTREAICSVERVSEKWPGEEEMCAIMVVRQFMFPSDSRNSIVNLLSL